MRESGRILGIILGEIEAMIKPGMSSWDIDQYAEKRMREFDVRPAFKGYNGFPNCICANVNEQVVHGIPNKNPLKEGDIITIDCGVIYQGFYSDSAITVPVGKVAQDIQDFIDTAYRALDKAIDVIRPGIRTNQISQAIENTIKKEHYGIIRDLSGHGIGKDLHEDPYILNYKERSLGPILQVGMVFAIEPIITMGKPETITLPDAWTIVTRDGSLATQVEHTVAVTENGAEVLTIRPK